MEAHRLRAERRRRAPRPRGRAISPRREDGRRRFVAGAIGPTNRTLSISPDVNNPGYRAVTFDAGARRLCRAGARPDRRRRRPHPDRDDLRHAQRQGRDRRDEAGLRRDGRRLPMMISGTITDLSGRTLSGQTPDRVLAFGPPRRAASRSASTARSARGRCAPISRRSVAVADTLVCAYPNAGLPNEFGLYDESPEATAAHARRIRRSRPRQHRRRLLRHDAGPYPGDRARPSPARRRARFPSSRR